MKLPEKKKPKKQKIKNKRIEKPKKEKVLVVAQEYKFARYLSGNEKKKRDRVLKTFKKWLLSCFEKGYEFNLDDFCRIWKGLFYAVWMSDKPLVQEELCDSIAQVLDLFPSDQIQSAVMMVKAGFKVLATEWYGIDQHRMDKFLMLVRRYLRGGFRCLLRDEWSLTSCEMFSEMLSGEDGILAVKTPMYARNSLSMIQHITDCYLEELSKVSQGSIPDASIAALLRPFCLLVCSSEGQKSVAARRLLTELVRQSELGLEYDDAARAWQKMGCPEGGPEALQRVSDDEDEEEAEDVEDDESAVDPRAGRVSVSLRPLPVPAALLAQQLRALRSAAGSKVYRRATVCAERFEKLAKNEYPLKLPETETQIREPNLDRHEPMRAASRLHKLEKNLVNTSDELALRGLSRKHRKRLLAKSRSGVSLVDEMTEKSDSTDGEWKVESTEDAKNEVNKENKNKKRTRKRKITKENGTQENNKKPKINNSTNTVNKDKNNKKNDKQTDRKLQDKPAKQAKEDKVTKTNSTVKSVDNKLKTKEAKVNNKVEKEKVRTEKVKTKAKLVVNKVKNYQKQVNKKESPKKIQETPKKVKFVLKNNGMQGTVEYYKSVRQSPNIPFDSSKKPVKTNLKPSTPSPINPFFKKKFKL